MMENLTKEQITPSTLSDYARALDPVQLSLDCGITPQPFQEKILRSQANRLILLASRQVGKSAVVGLLALHRAISYSNSLILIVSRSQDQAKELLREHIATPFFRLQDTVEAKVTELTMEFSNN